MLDENGEVDADNYKDLFLTDPAFHMRTIIIRDYIGYLINDVITASALKISEYFDKYNPKFMNEKDVINELCIVLSDNTAKLAMELNNEITNKVVFSDFISTADSKSEYVIIQLFKAFYKHPKQLPDYVLTRYYAKMGSELNRLKMKDDEIRNDPRFIRAICDHIAGMTDQFASREYRRLYIPE